MSTVITAARQFVVLCEAQLAAARNMPEVRRAAREMGGAVIAAPVFLTGFVFAKVAAFEGLSGRRAHRSQGGDDGPQEWRARRAMVILELISLDGPSKTAGVREKGPGFEPYRIGRSHLGRAA
jgi:hypothetical protein